MPHAHPPLQVAAMPKPEAARTGRGSGPALFRLAALCFGALGGWVILTAVDLVYYTPVGPGPGFFPFWLGTLLVLLCLAILVASFVPGMVPEFPANLVPRGTPLSQMLITFGCIAGFALLVERLGFVIVMFAVMTVLLRVNRVPVITALLVSLGSSLGIGYAFVTWLGVFLPIAPWGLFEAIGL
ncbi:tripartite tricarboxylate transporter TctB family protein [Teichococcus vastitatis]|uniref:Tripartite tricarboxylate transporter TctB family protein n=1 Tax=Teichococcus vastitatis TaxID=2307076 RepID=A0ABS9W2H1_9PROT|nr:tripartite tricarboxylate transporter TctB family protein [Pseudoroseomonas vastitatis]MCI0753483.1 tripartite tricarboxylate transporter TctB family protein [Pseudoroseomonas vastitatis]